MELRALGMEQRMLLNPTVRFALCSLLFTFCRQLQTASPAQGCDGLSVFCYQIPLKFVVRCSLFISSKSSVLIPLPSAPCPYLLINSNLIYRFSHKAIYYSA